MECQGLPWRVWVLRHVALYRLSLGFPRVAPHNNVTDRQAGGLSTAIRSRNLAVVSLGVIGLARADLALLKPHLAPVDLPVSTQLETANARIDTVYFKESGFASVVADGSGKRNIAVGIMVGKA
jgi:hypothetical protein